jgi:predicted unusual protein kinase regulating ubiquinone biosynthesis (AarF/ABC1/UbiB family)
MTLKTPINSTKLLFSIFQLLLVKDETAKTNQQIKVGQKLKNLIENMSPTYIKFGQLISHRPDILLNDKTSRESFFAAIEELENAFLSIKTKEY